MGDYVCQTVCQFFGFWFCLLLGLSVFGLVVIFVIGFVCQWVCLSVGSYVCQWVCLSVGFSVSWELCLVLGLCVCGLVVCEKAF